jgi:hypothetical protein
MVLLVQRLCQEPGIRELREGQRSKLNFACRRQLGVVHLRVLLNSIIGITRPRCIPAPRRR